MLLATAWMLWGSAAARESLREGFDGGPVPGREGRGWTQTDSARAREVPFSSRAAGRGAISFDLQRRTDAEPGARGSVFSFRDRENRNLLGVSVEWVSEPDGASRLVVGAPFRGSLPGAGAISPRHTVSLGREIPPGHWVRLELVWNERDGSTQVYADGIRRDAKVFPPAHSRFGPSSPTTAPGGSPGSPAQETKTTAYLPWPVGTLLPQAATLR
jgi:hypothetical protein